MTWQQTLKQYVKRQGYALVTLAGWLVCTLGLGLTIVLTSGWEPTLFTGLTGVFLLVLGVLGENK